MLRCRRISGPSSLPTKVVVVGLYPLTDSIQQIQPPDRLQFVTKVYGHKIDQILGLVASQCCSLLAAWSAESFARSARRYWRKLTTPKMTATINAAVMPAITA